MNKYEHIESSIKQIGGNEQDHITIHELIDLNKTVTSSIFGRFFLHHGDVGLVIIQKILNPEQDSERNKFIKQVVDLHLTEDFGRVLSFKNDWLPVLSEVSDKLPRLTSTSQFLERLHLDPRMTNLSFDDIVEIEEWFRLKKFGLPDSYKKILEHDAIFAIFGHALGIDLLGKIIGKKFKDYWTMDVLTGFLNCRFEINEPSKERVPTLIDYELVIPDKLWMHAPKTIETQTKEEEEEDITQYFPGHNRQPCNVD